MSRVQDLTLKLLDEALGAGEHAELQRLVSSIEAAAAEHIAWVELEVALRGQQWQSFSTVGRRPRKTHADGDAARHQSGAWQSGPSADDYVYSSPVSTFFENRCSGIFSQGGSTMGKETVVTFFGLCALAFALNAAHAAAPALRRSRSR